MTPLQAPVLFYEHRSLGGRYRLPVLERFAARYRVDHLDYRPAAWAPLDVTIDGFHDLMAKYAGASFNDGLYRLHMADTERLAASWIREAFPGVADRCRCFAFDWLGRQFALDLARHEGDEPLVAMLEPGTGEVLEIPATFGSFHDNELVNYAEEALAESFFAAWAETARPALPLSQTECVGYRVPLFLGGTDEVGNLERTNLDVYWTLSAQLLTAARSAVPGGRIRIADARET